MRLRNNPNALVEMREMGMLVENYPVTIGNNTVIELGMGKGEMICEMAFQNPDKEYIGVEKFATVATKASKRAAERNLKNIKFIVDDIANLPEIFNGKVSTVWLTFSDPWPKDRHTKRRLTYKTFLDIYKEILNDDGVLRFKTDNDKLFNYSLESLGEYGANIIKQTTDLHNFDEVKDNIQTGYEIKWSSQGKNINYLEAKFN